MSSSSPAFTSPPSVAAAPGHLPAEQLLRIYDLMLRTRVLEERLITMYKQGDGYFWIGGPGEEAFNVPLGLLVDKGSGVDHDFCICTIARAAPCSRWAPIRSIRSAR